MMRKVLIAALAACSAAALLVACGPGDTGGKAGARSVLGWSEARHKPEGPVFSGTGAIATVEGETVTINQEGVADAALAPGITPFYAFADVAADAPLDPGAKVAFSFQKAGETLVLTELKPG